METSKTLKIEFLKGTTKNICKISLPSDSKISKVIEEICKDYDISRPSDYLLYSSNDSEEWLKLDKTIEDYDLNDQSNLSLKNKYYFANVCLYISPQAQFCRSILVDVLIPFSRIFYFILHKFHLNPSTEYCILALTNDNNLKKIFLDLSFMDQNLSQSSKILIVEQGKDISPELISNSNDRKSKPLVVNLTGNVTINRKKRWVAVDDNFFFIYKSLDDVNDYKTPIETVNLLNYYCEFDEKDKKRLSIDLISYKLPKNVYSLKFSVEEEAQSWFLSLKQKCISDSKLFNPEKLYFGAPLRKVTSPDDPIPFLVRHCIEILSKKALELEGIFRLSGTQSEIDNIKAEYNNGNHMDLSNVADIHVISGLLKSYFRELPEPLMTYELYDLFINTDEESNELKKIKIYRELILCLPKVNRATLEFLIVFLAKVSEHSAKNKMAVHNLATVFAPNLLQSRYKGNILLTIQDTPLINGVISTLITKYDSIFSKYFPTEQPPVAVKALYDFTAKNKDQLSFKAGDVIKLIKKNGVNSWWYGNIDNIFGLFPRSYVEILPLTKKQKFFFELKQVETKINEERQRFDALRLKKNSLLTEIEELKLIKKRSEDQKNSMKNFIEEILQYPIFERFKRELENIYLYIENCNTITSNIIKKRSAFMSEQSSLGLFPVVEQKKRSLDTIYDLINMINSKLSEEKNLRDMLEKANEELFKNLTELSLIGLK